MDIENYVKMSYTTKIFFSEIISTEKYIANTSRLFINIKFIFMSLVSKRDPWQFVITYYIIVNNKNLIFKNKRIVFCFFHKSHKKNSFVLGLFQLTATIISKLKKSCLSGLNVNVHKCYILFVHWCAIKIKVLII